eukprot:CAMPEP_0174371618 /NCGR_PEP_ID=MMETSP0811_2-20130205/100431_1 /TAXON_ID=73025 ORGANISM="Eutreptiella gymnastica-like, Strain CCMP1594" /NCGR_SAMPLE_ID=MMETSP0811_2 /ASSEMBLY_ACC=CAM_ASM_000667 /LENGTH=82 /DNA_ID=CAMNT_0015518167 /DNA_START=151 /DNA_END=397 /DNA_ORIENTATION=+
MPMPCRPDSSAEGCTKGECVVVKADDKLRKGGDAQVHVGAHAALGRMTFGVDVGVDDAPVSSGGIECVIAALQYFDGVQYCV